MPGEGRRRRPVRVVTVDERPGGETVTLPGQSRPGGRRPGLFRIGGQLIERSVNVGDQISAGQIVGRLDRSTWSDAVQALARRQPGRGHGLP